jgi:hypothetical protein
LLVRAAPAFVGIFWGAPLLTREFETGSYRLAWTQSVSRSRWLLTRLVVLGLVTVVVTGLLTLTLTWWYRSVDTVSTNQYAVFDARDIAPIAYALFAFAAGAFIGAVVRRTLPAMVGTLGVFVFTRVAVVQWIRPHLLSPRHLVTSFGEFGFLIHNGGQADLVARPPDMPNTWVQATQIVTSSGHATTAAERAAFVHQYCPNIGPPPVGVAHGKVLGGPGAGAVHTCRDQAAHMFKLAVTYQPASRYWTFQWLEVAIFAVLALAFGVGCYLWVTRRSS